MHKSYGRRKQRKFQEVKAQVVQGSNCSNMVKAINQQIEEAQQIPSTRNLIKVTCRHMIRLLKTSDKVLKNNQREKTHTKEVFY